MIAALAPGVEPLHVGRRVTLGEAQALRLGEGFAVAGALLGHLREDVVRRPVDDAHDPPDRLAAEALAQAAHDRDATCHGCFEQEVDAVAVGRLEQLDADVGEQLLVGRDHRLAAGESCRDQLACGLDAADDLDDEVDVGIRDDAIRVAGEHAGAELDVALTRQVAHGDAGDVEAEPGAGLDLLGLVADEPDEGGADVAAPEDTDADLAHFHG